MPEIEAVNAIKMELETFAQSILENKKPRVDVLDGLQSIRIGLSNYPRNRGKRTTTVKDLKIILLIACTTLLSIGCDIINPEEPLPTLIYIAEPSFQVRNAQEGTANQNITEFWVTANGDFLGAYPVPSVVPILASGNIDLKIQAGTRDNGISATPELYPFLKILQYLLLWKPWKGIPFAPLFFMMREQNLSFLKASKVRDNPSQPYLNPAHQVGFNWSQKEHLKAIPLL